MVLDARHHQSAPVSNPAGIYPPVHSPVHAALGEPADLGGLLSQVIQQGNAPGQARAVEQLRQLVPTPEGQERIWEILALPGEPRRLVAAQVLGYHRQWLSSPSGIRRVLTQARQEEDPAVQAALVWCLRQAEEVREFLLHPDPHIAREAALGLPLGRKTLAPLVRAFRAAARPEMERIFLHKLRTLHPPLMGELVGHLLEEEWGEGDNDRLAALFACLPQVPLFELFVEERGKPELASEKGLAAASRARNWHLFSRLAERALQRGPTIELLRLLLSRSGEDEAFARRHASVLRLALNQADAVMGPELLKHFERLTFKASEDRLVRLAQLLVELSFRLEGPSGVQASTLLEEWKQRSPGLKLKIYHLQQRLA
ncbi:MAG: hypothetical protein IT369_18060 [Candidatus Latescibacteria bacterium]|nr:hypothetical protein [Candidatus Latescibacterota bacterium]